MTSDLMLFVTNPIACTGLVVFGFSLGWILRSLGAHREVRDWIVEWHDAKAGKTG